MPAIPLVQSQRSNITALPEARATGETYGAGIGRALIGLGNSLESASHAGATYIEKEKKKGRDEKLAFAIAKASDGMAKISLEEQQNAPADGTGVAKNTFERHTSFVDEQADVYFPDDAETRTEFKKSMYGRMGGYAAQSQQFEFNRREENARFQANDALGTLQNTVRADATKYDQVVNDGYRVIDARPDLPEAGKQVARDEWRQHAAYSRFQGLLEASRSLDDLSAIERELKLGSETEDGRALPPDERSGQRNWKREMKPQAYEQILDQLKSAKSVFATKADTEARASLDGLEERNKNFINISDDEMRATQNLVTNSGNVALQGRMQRIVRDQQIYRSDGKLPPAQLQANADERLGRAQSKLPPQLSAAITEAQKIFPSVSSGFLSGTIEREYGGVIAKAQKEGREVDFSVKNPESTAKGVLQFTEKTWVSLLRENGGALATRIGVDPNLSDAQLLELRNDPRVSTLMGAAYAEKNIKTLKQSLGRELTDGELYMAHFLGPGDGNKGGASTLIRAYTSQPDTSAAELLPKEAAVNRGVFYAKDGRARTVREVYNNISATYGNATPSQTAFDDSQTYQRMTDNARKAIADDPITYARDINSHDIPQLSDEGGFAARGQVAASVASYYSIPGADMKPFTRDEATAISTQIKNANADETLGIMAQIQQMDVAAGAKGNMAQAAYNQLGLKDSAMGYAARLAYDGGDATTASTIVRGQKRLDADPSSKSLFGNKNEADKEFATFARGALRGVKPEEYDAVLKAAKAHYAETAFLNGDGEFDAKTFQNSIRSVLGSGVGISIGKVNGADTILPQGVDEDTMETALDNMTDKDYIDMSTNKKPPMHLSGEVIAPDEMAYEGKLQFIGDGNYRIEMGDRTFAVTDEVDPQTGRAKLYIFRPDALKLKELARGAAGYSNENKGHYR